MSSPIDAVIQQLEDLIQWSKNHDSRIGYFASLYLRVTNTIKSKIGTGYFDDDERMEHLDANFAQRYVDAVIRYQNNDPKLSKAWAVGLDATTDGDLVIIQQLFLSMNPHINIDLGAAAAETCPGNAIHALKDDFNRINDVLASLVPVVVREIDKLSPLIDLVTDISGKLDDAIVNFSMKVARDFAWKMALELAPLSPEAQKHIIDQRNVTIADLGQKIINPGTLLDGLLDVVRKFESKDIDRNIDTLNSGNPLAAIPDLGDLSQVPKTSDPEPPNKVYYFDIADGTWGGVFNFKLKNWSALMASEIGLKNKFLVVMMTWFQKLFGDGTISSEISVFPDEGPFGVAKNKFRIHKGWFTLFRSDEDYILSPNGSGVKIDAHVRFGPIPFLFREHDIYPAVVYEGGYRNTYHIKLLATRFLGQYTVYPDGKQVHSVLENEWAIADEMLHKISGPTSK